MIIKFGKNHIETNDISAIPEISKCPLYGKPGFMISILMKNGKSFEISRWCEVDDELAVYEYIVSIHEKLVKLWSDYSDIPEFNIPQVEEILCQK